MNVSKVLKIVLPIVVVALGVVTLRGMIASKRSPDTSTKTPSALAVRLSPARIWPLSLKRRPVCSAIHPSQRSVTPSGVGAW